MSTINGDHAEDDDTRAWKATALIELEAQAAYVLFTNSSAEPSAAQELLHNRSYTDGPNAKHASSHWFGSSRTARLRPKPAQHLLGK